MKLGRVRNTMRHFFGAVMLIVSTATLAGNAEPVLGFKEFAIGMKMSETPRLKSFVCNTFGANETACTFTGKETIAGMPASKFTLLYTAGQLDRIGVHSVSPGSVESIAKVIRKRYRGYEINIDPKPFPAPSYKWVLEQGQIQITKWGADEAYVAIRSAAWIAKQEPSSATDALKPVDAENDF